MGETQKTHKSQEEEVFQRVWNIHQTTMKMMYELKVCLE